MALCPDVYSDDHKVLGTTARDNSPGEHVYKQLPKEMTNAIVLKVIGSVFHKNCNFNLIQ